MCEGRRERRQDGEGFWLVPFCNKCAPSDFAFPNKTHYKQQWENLVNIIRQQVIGASTRARYESGIREAAWPPSTIFDAITYLSRASPSKIMKIMLKQAVVEVRRVHSARDWPPPPFDHPILQSYRQALLKTPIQTPLQLPINEVFSVPELHNMFAVLTPKLGRPSLHYRYLVSDGHLKS